MGHQVRRRIGLELITGFFVLLFVYSALSKFFRFESFQLTLSRSPLIGKAALAVSVLVPSVELAVVALLFPPLTRRFGLAAATLLMAAFAGYVGYLLLWAPHLPCSCGGLLQGMSWRAHLVFNLSAAAVGAVGWRWQLLEERHWVHRSDQAFIDKQDSPKT